MIRTTYTDRASWLDARMNGIGASDAAPILGISPWVTIDQLFDEKTGKVAPKDLSNNKKVQFGIEAEDHIRNLVALDFPQYEMIHHPFDILGMDEYPFITATLDGELRDRVTQEMGLLEAKTGSFRNLADLEPWENGKIPMHYFCQVCQQLLVTGYPWALVVARLKRDPYKDSDEGLPEIRWYYRMVVAAATNVRESMDAVKIADIAFWKKVKGQRRPGTIIGSKGDSTWISKNRTRW
jgi:putative phage-type endonuclease